MAVVLGYGGLANTNGARDFSGKAAAVAPLLAVSGLVMAGGGSVGPTVGHAVVRTLHAKGAPA